VVNDVRHMTAAAQKGMSEFVLLTQVKARPVLVLSEVLAPYEEVLVLRLTRLEKLTGSDAARVRDMKDEALFYLNPGSFPGLHVETAAIVSALVRLPMGAVDTSVELGALNENELRVVHERIVRSHGLNVEMLVLQQARELLHRVQQRRAED
jgi:hypothetical protein